MMALPGALAGIVWMLFATHTTLSVPALMGAIMSIGVATSNSILMITFANEQRDIFTLDLSPASVVTLYLLPGLNEKLLPQLRRLRPGARVISHQFPIPGVKPDQTVDVDQPGSSHVLYLWHAPLAGP